MFMLYEQKNISYIIKLPISKNFFKVNNAGLMSNKNFNENPEYIELMLKVNVLGPMLVMMPSIIN